MTSHKFRVGQIVGLLAPATLGSSPRTEFKILQLLRQEAGEGMYRIKTIKESMTRVAKESDIEVLRST